MSEARNEGEAPKVGLLGHLSVHLDAEYQLRPSRDAISKIERQTGKSLTQLAVQAGSLALSVEELGVCVCELMRAYGTFDPDAGPNYKAAKPNVCADLIYDTGPVDVSRRIAVIFTAATAGGYTASGEPKAVGTKTMEPTPTAD